MTMNPALILEAKIALERIKTYDDITRFERVNAQMLHNPEIIEDSSEDESPLLGEKMDQRRLHGFEHIYGKYEEAVRSNALNLPLFKPTAAEAARSPVEDILESVRHQPPEKRADILAKQLLQAARNTVVLPAECLPPSLLQQPGKQVLELPKRAMRSQIDSIYQSVRLTEVDDERVAALNSPNKGSPGRRVYEPSRHQLKLNAEAEQDFEQLKARQRYREVQYRQDMADKTRLETTRILSKPKIYQLVDNSKMMDRKTLVELKNMDKKVEQLQQTCNLLKGYDFARK